MEIRARYVQMGAFTLAVLLAGFAFVYWLNNSVGLRDRTAYQVRFDGPVSGLLKGSAVLFNGIRVGEVTALRLDPANPRRVDVTVAIDRAAPIRADTIVGIDFQGLTGSPVIALTGGSPDQPLAGTKGTLPVLVAEPSAGQTMSQAARDVLRRLDTVLAENAQPLRTMIANLDTFAGALARNSDRLDGIVAGLERMTGGAKARMALYELSAPRVSTSLGKALSAQLVIPDPTALAALDSEKIQKAAPGGATSALPDAQWSDTLPKLLQLKLIRALEDANAFAGVSRSLDALSVDFQLLIDIRRFQLTASGAAEVEFAAKVLDGKGRIVGSQLFTATARVQGEGAPAAVAALDEAFAGTAAELIPWTMRTVAERLGQPEPSKTVAPKKGKNG